jgi:hypothetical protein
MPCRVCRYARCRASVLRSPASSAALGPRTAGPARALRSRPHRPLSVARGEAVSGIRSGSLTLTPLRSSGQRRADASLCAENVPFAEVKGGFPALLSRRGPVSGAVAAHDLEPVAADDVQLVTVGPDVRELLVPRGRGEPPVLLAVAGCFSSSTVAYSKSMRSRDGGPGPACAVAAGGRPDPPLLQGCGAASYGAGWTGHAVRPRPGSAIGGSTCGLWPVTGHLGSDMATGRPQRARSISSRLPCTVNRASRWDTKIPVRGGGVPRGPASKGAASHFVS